MRNLFNPSIITKFALHSTKCSQPGGTSAVQRSFPGVKNNPAAQVYGANLCMPLEQ